MTEHIPVRTIETIDSAKPTRPSRVQADSPIYTRRFNGRYRTLRLFGAGLLLMLFFGTAWLEWNGRQAVLWDLPNRQFHIFGTTFWPQDFILLSSILIIAAFALFFITVLAGRVWCGYTCPQSVWTWIFMRVEQITEGDRNQRIKLDATPWSLEKLLRRGVKHGLWLLISLLTALAFVGYFTPIRPLLANFVSLELGTTTAFWLLLFSAATYANAGWLREKVCRDMCPYARFQSVMFDSDTLVIAYDAARGESRGPRKKGRTTERLGWATAWTARCVCKSAQPASTSATVSSWSVSAAAPASTPATASWTNSTTRAAWCAIAPSVHWRVARPAGCARVCSVTRLCCW